VLQEPRPASFDRVGKDYRGYVAFDKQQITIAESDHISCRCGRSG
jgi:hypothetical protein